MANADDKLDPRVWRVVAVFVLGAIMSVLDTTIVNVALKDISIDLHAPIDHIQWITTGYLLAIAAVIPLAGWSTRRFGARKIYVGSLALFTFGSLLCALAWSANSLIAFRVLQGLGGGLVMPVGQVLIVKAAGPKHLGRVMSAAGIPILLAPILGPTLGGLLIEFASWHWIFLINLPIGAIAITAALRILPVGEINEEAGKLDFIGLGMAMGGAVGLTYGLAETASAGSVTSPSVLLPFFAGLVLLASFVLRSLKVPNPLLDIRLFKQRSYAAGSATTFACGAMLFGGMILMPLYFQTVRGLSALDTGLLLAPQGIGAATAMTVAGRMTDRIGGGRTALYGTFVTLVATVPFILIGARTPYPLIDLAMLVRGFGMGMTFMPAMTAAYRKLERTKINDATALLTVLQRIGGSIGTAIFSVALQSRLSDGGGPAAAADAFDKTYILVLAVAFLTLIPVGLLALTEREEMRKKRGPRTTPLTPANDVGLVKLG